MSATPGLQLVMAGISKAYPGVVALSDARLEARGGEATAVMGANGAGKSTLMNVLGGVTRPDAGSISIGGQSINLASPREAANHGIAFVHQELTMLPTLSVQENIFIDDFPIRNGFIDRAVMRAKSAEILARLGCTISPDRIVGELSTGDRQMIEIARAMRREPRVIIFDEPTSSLTQPEKQRLFAVIQGLKREGVTILYITHFLDEIFEICEEVFVMRAGRTVGSGPIGSFRPADIVRMMLGEVDVGAKLKVPSDRPGKTVLEVRGLSRGTALKEISFELRQGEVVGLWGLLGAGRTELARALVGLDPIDRGSIRWHDGTALAPITPKDLHERTGFVTEDRRGEGLLLPLSVNDNIALPSLKRFLNAVGLLRVKPQSAMADDMIGRLHIKVASRDQSVGTLSGGNQQKVVFGRWLATEPELFILDEPTRGLDVSAKAEILTLTADLARAGATVLLISSELDELMRIADRYLVIVRGAITAELPGSSTRGDLMDALSPGAIAPRRVAMGATA